ncbi:MAG: helix-turn-helix transcriptional regulator [Planctomycetota bacterium]|nr:helix-turn-helix transcriptional regulator [Planctomycetota bacterium]
MTGDRGFSNCMSFEDFDRRMIQLGEWRPATPAEISEADRIISDPHTRWSSIAEVTISLGWSRIELARKSRKMSQTELAEKSGLSQSRISRIENKPESMTIDELRRLAAALDVDVAALIEAAA